MVYEMKVLDLFSGIGGFSLGLERAGMETVAFCEYDEKCRQVLQKHWPDIPQYNDVRTLTGEQLERDGITVDLICGGYPCQPFSVAGKREGQADDRHLWPELFRLVQEIRPTWILCENVAGHISMGLDSVLADLESEAYQCQTLLIPACGVGAYHRRYRVWIIAHSDELANGQQHINAATWNDSQRENNDVANTNSKRRRGGKAGEQDAEYVGQSPGDKIRREWKFKGWDVEPSVGRVANGVPDRLDRLKQLGNAVVPQIPEIIGRAIMSYEQ